MVFNYDEFKDEIKRSVSVGNNLEYTQRLVEAKFNEELKPIDIFLLEDHYVDCLRDLLLTNVPEQIVNPILPSYVSVFIEKFQSIKQFSDLKRFVDLDLLELGGGYSYEKGHVKLPHLLHSVIYLLNDLHKTSDKLKSHEDKYIYELKIQCLTLLKLKTEEFKNEVSFSDSVSELFRSTKTPNELCKTLGLLPKIPDVECEFHFKVFLNNLLEVKLSDYADLTSQIQKVQTNANKIIHQNSFFINKDLLESIYAYIVPTVVEEKKIDGRFLLEVQGKHIVISKVIKEIEKNLEDLQQIEEVRFVRCDVIHIDTSFTARIWQGKNIVVFADTAIVSCDKTETWDVSGKDGQSKFTNEAGTGNDGRGLPGIDGQPGESGGNVVVMVNNLIHGHNLCIKSNGGKGSSGQKGGSGTHGKDGHSIRTEEDFTKSFPPVAKLSNHNKLKNLNTTKDSVLMNFQSLDDFYIGCVRSGPMPKQEFEQLLSFQISNKKDFYFKTTSEDGCRVTFSFCFEGLFTRCQSFLLHEGALGEEGKPGGCGGQGGLKGYAGKVTVLEKYVENEDFKNEANDGEDGTPGSEGLHGNPGQSGVDRGYLDKSIYLSLSYPKIYAVQERENCKLKITYNTEKRGVYARHNGKYAEIVTKKNDFQKTNSMSTSVSLTDSHYTNLKNNCIKMKTNSINSYHVQRKKTICQESIRKHYELKVSASNVSKLKHVFENVNDLFLNVNRESQCSQESTTEANVTRRVSYLNTKCEIHHYVKEHEENINLSNNDENGKEICKNERKCALEMVKLMRDNPLNWENWCQLIQVRLNISQLQDLWEIASTHQFSCNNVFNNKFCNKYQLVVLEEMAIKFDETEFVNIQFSSDSLFIPPEMSFNDNKLFTIVDQNILNGSKAGYDLLYSSRCLILKRFKGIYENTSDDDCAVNATFLSFLNEFPSQTSNNVIQLNESIKQFNDKKEKASSCLFEVLKSGLKNKKYEFLYNDLAESIVTRNNESLAILLGKMSDYWFIKTINSINERKQMKFEWSSLGQGSEIYQELCKSFENYGPLSHWYREFLAHNLGINIQVYEMSVNNKLVLKYDHNPNSHISEHFLLMGNDMSFLRINVDHVNLKKNQKSKCLIFNQILACIDPLNEKQQFDEFKSNIHFLLDNCRRGKITKSTTTRAKLMHIFMEDESVINILNCYNNENDKSLLKCKLEKLKLEYSGCMTHLYYMSLRFENEGGLISAEELACVVTFILKCSFTETHVLTILSWILAAYSQTQWLIEIILMKLEINFNKTLDPELKTQWRNYLSQQNEREILMLLIDKINDKAFNITQVAFGETIYLLSNIRQAHLGLEELDLDEWRYFLKGKFWSHQLQKITNWTSNTTLKKASYHLATLENLVGTELCTNLIGVFKMHTHELDDKTMNNIPDILKLIMNKEVCLNDHILQVLKSTEISNWVSALKQKYFCRDEDRSLSKLIDIIKMTKNTSEDVISNLPSVFSTIENSNDILQRLKTKFKSMKELEKWVRILVGDSLSDPPSFLSKMINKTLSITDKTFVGVAKSLISLIYNIKDEESSSVPPISKEDVVKKSKEAFFATAVAAVEICYNVTLRDTQKLAAMMMVKRDMKCLLSQVSTGEGKSYIIVLVTIMKVLEGKKVDIITSSHVLAERDAENYQQVYKLFGITVGHNCSDNIEERRKAYSNCNVVYGELANFQRDYLLDDVYNKNILGDRSFETIILDEVDSMLLDKGNNSLYLTHEIPGLDKLEPVFTFIWRALHISMQSNNLSDTKQIIWSIKNNILHNVFDLISKEELCCLDTRLNENQTNKTWQYLVREKVIDNSGKILKQYEDINPETLPVNCITNDLLKYIFKKVRERKKCFIVPNYLKYFVQESVEEWIKNGIIAMTMKPGEDYVIDVNRSDTNCDRSPNIIIVDKDTGTDSVNSQWENGLHQFLQLKHGCRLSLISLKAVFISNVHFLKKYKSLFGLTGTLGTEIERDLLKEIYKVDFVTIPTAKSKLFTEEEPILCSSTEDWCQTICDEAYKKIKQNRSILIIVQTVNDVKLLKKEFEQVPWFKGKNKNIHTYTRDYEKFIVAENLNPGQVIIATNLAGRGTDIKLTKDLANAGGLHVCFSYLPCNSRIEEQGFGRTARNGQAGSGQMIINIGSKNITSSKMIQLLQQRDLNEHFRITDIKNYYKNHIEKEEECFDKFKKEYHEIKQTKHSKEIQEILQQASLDQWAIWLEQNKTSLDVDQLEVLLNTVKSLRQDTFKDWSSNITDPFQLIKLGLAFSEKKDYESSISLFNRVIEEESSFSEAAYYYRLKDKSRNESNLSKEEILKDLKCVVSLLNERKQNSSLAAYSVDFLKQNNPLSNLVIESYKNQQLSIAQIYEVFIQSVNNIVGSDVKLEDFVLPTVLNSEDAFKVFDCLIEKGIITKPCFKGKMTEADFPFACRYGLSNNELCNVLQKCKGNEFDKNETLECLKKKLILPSREKLWSELLANQVLINEKRYSNIDLNKLNEIDPSLLSVVESLKSSYDEKVNELWLYEPSETNLFPNHSILVQKAKLENKIGEHKYKYLLSKSAIYENAVALYMGSDDDIKFEHFDHLEKKDFLRIGIACNVADQIIQELINANIIQRMSVGDGYKFIANHKILDNFKLQIHQAFSDDVVSLIKVCFAFRIAYQEILSLKSEQKDGNKIYLPLQICLYDNIINDLIENDLISRHFVKPVADISKTIQKLFSNGMTLREYENLFNRLYDDSTTKMIVESLVVNKWLVRKNFLKRSIFVINEVRENNLSADLLRYKKSIELILQQQLSLMKNETVCHISSVLLNFMSSLQEIEIPVFSTKPLLDVLQQHGLPTSESTVFILNGFDQVLLLEEKKYTSKMLIQTGCVALFGVAQIAAGLSMMFLSPICGNVVAEGVTDIIFAVKCAFSGHFSQREYLLTKMISLSLNAFLYFFNPLQLFKSSFGENLTGSSVMSNVKNESSTVFGKATNYVKSLFKSSAPTPQVSKSIMVKTIAKQVVAQSIAGCSLGVTIASIEKYLEPQLVQIGEECVKIILSKNDELDNADIWEYIKEMYLYLGAEDSLKIIRLCFCEELEKFRKDTKTDWTIFLKHLNSVVDGECTNCFQTLWNGIKETKNICSTDTGILLLQTLPPIIAKIKHVICFSKLAQSLYSGNSAIITKLINNLEHLFKKKVEELSVSQRKLQIKDSELDSYIYKVKEELKQDIKSVLVENISHKIIHPTINYLNNKFVVFLSKTVSEKCFTFLREEEIMENRKKNEAIFKTDEILPNYSVHVNQLRRFYCIQYSECLLKILDIKRSTCVFLEILKLENDCPLSDLFMEMFCFVIAMALRQVLNFPKLRIVVESSGINQVYGYTEENPDVITVRVASDEDFRSNLRKNGLLLKNCCNNVYSTITKLYPHCKGMTSEALHKLLISYLENNTNCDSDAIFVTRSNTGKEKKKFRMFENSFNMMLTTDKSKITLQNNPWNPTLESNGNSLGVTSKNNSCQISQYSKLYIITCFQAALAKINSHLHIIQPYLKYFNLTLEDFDETDHIIIPLKSDIPGDFFDSYASVYELVTPFLNQGNSNVWADYKITMKLVTDKVQSRILYSVEPVNRQGQFALGTSGHITMDVRCGDYVYTEKDCSPEIGELIMPGLGCFLPPEGRIDVIILGDSLVKDITMYIQISRCIIKSCANIPPTKLKSEVIRFLNIFSEARYILCYFGISAVTSKICAKDFMGQLSDLLSVIKLKMKNAQIIVYELLFRHPSKHFNVTKAMACKEKVTIINKYIKEYCCREKLIYVPINNVIGDGDFTTDGLHLNRRGSERLSLYTEAIVSTLKKDDTKKQTF